MSFDQQRGMHKQCVGRINSNGQKISNRKQIQLTLNGSQNFDLNVLKYLAFYKDASNKKHLLIVKRKLTHIFLFALKKISLSFFSSFNQFTLFIKKRETMIVVYLC